MKRREVGRRRGKREGSCKARQGIGGDSIGGEGGDRRNRNETGRGGRGNRTASGKRKGGWGNQTARGKRKGG